jgi:hypothetical protein
MRFRGPKALKDRIEYAHLAASENRSEKTADGRMATEAAGHNGKESTEVKPKPS